MMASSCERTDPKRAVGRRAHQRSTTEERGGSTPTPVSRRHVRRQEAAHFMPEMELVRLVEEAPALMRTPGTHCHIHEKKSVLSKRVVENPRERGANPKIF